VLALVLAWFPCVSGRADFDAGMAAYETGDFDAALEAWRPLAEQGEGDAAFHVARMYLLGQGVVPDLGIARQWMRNAALAGHTVAADCLGVSRGMGRKGRRRLLALARDGDAVAQYFLAGRIVSLRPEGSDDVVRWYRSAAEGGVAAARLEMARRHLSGDGVVRDPREAARWLHLAAEQSAPVARALLGELYLESGELHDPELSAQRFRKAAEEGDAYAQLVLALMYAEGRGIERDPVLAYAWLIIASDGTLPSGHDVMLNVLRRIVTSEMTEEQIAAAEALALRLR
jgi:TPR repeat protein